MLLMMVAPLYIFLCMYNATFISMFCLSNRKKMFELNFVLLCDFFYEFEFFENFEEQRKFFEYSMYVYFHLHL